MGNADEYGGVEHTYYSTYSVNYNRCGATTYRMTSQVDRQTAVTWQSGLCNKTVERTSGTYPNTETYVYYMNVQTHETKKTVYTTDTFDITQTQSVYTPTAGRKYTFLQSTMVDKAYPDFITTTGTTAVDGWDTYSTYTCERLITEGTTTTIDEGNPITHTRCPPVTTLLTETLNQVPSATSYGLITECFRYCINYYNTDQQGIVLVRVKEGLNDGAMMPLKQAIYATPIPPNSPPIKHCWDSTTATPFLNKHEFLGGDVVKTVTRIANEDESFVTQAYTKIHSTFVSEEYPFWAETETATLLQIVSTTHGTVRAYYADGLTFSLTISGLEQQTESFPKLVDGQLESTEFNTDTDGRRNTASYSGIDWFNYHVSHSTDTIAWRGFAQEFINVTKDDYGNWEYAEDNTRVLTTIWDNVHVSEADYVSKVEKTITAVVEKTNLNWNNCRADHTYKSETIDVDIYNVTMIDRQPENGYGDFGQSFYTSPYDSARLIEGQPRCRLYEFYTMAYPAYQDIYAVGTGGMMFARLNAEFTTTILGNMSATANSALQRVKAFSIPVTITRANDETYRTTQIDVGNTRPSFTTANENTVLDDSSVEKLKHFHTAMTLAYFSQREYTATSWGSVYLETIESGYKIIREDMETYTSENYDPEQGNCHTHTFMRSEGIHKNGVMKVGGVLQNGEPRSYYLLVEHRGLPVVGQVTTFSNKCGGGTFETTYTGGVHELIGTQVSMIQTDAVINVGALKKELNSGKTMTPDEYEHFKL